MGRMIYLSGYWAIIKPLFIIFKNCINDSTFPEIWKKWNIYPIHQKKPGKEVINNYRPASSLPVHVKIFEGLVFYSLLENREKDQHLLAHQYDFWAHQYDVPG